VSSRRFPWLSGLLLAVLGALSLIVVVVRGVISVLNGAIVMAPLP
jgi:hypothetical protein